MLFAVIFPVIGVAMFVFAMKTTLAWRRFGRSIFEMAADPRARSAARSTARSGQGKVAAGTRPAFALSFVAPHHDPAPEKTGGTTEKILWQDEKWMRADLPQTGSDSHRHPGLFPLPDNRRESTPGKGDGVHWKLEASAKVSGPNFHAAFEVPVFKLPETPAAADDPTAPFQMSLDEMRKQIRSRIEVNDLPEGGREFLFPPRATPASSPARPPSG